MSHEGHFVHRNLAQLVIRTSVPNLTCTNCASCDLSLRELRVVQRRRIRFLRFCRRGAAEAAAQLAIRAFRVSPKGRPTGGGPARAGRRPPPAPAPPRDGKRAIHAPKTGHRALRIARSGYRALRTVKSGHRAFRTARSGYRAFRTSKRGKHAFCTAFRGCRCTKCTLSTFSCENTTLSSTWIAVFPAKRQRGGPAVLDSVRFVHARRCRAAAPRHARYGPRPRVRQSVHFVHLAP